MSLPQDKPPKKKQTGLAVVTGYAVEASGNGLTKRAIFEVEESRNKSRQAEGNIK